MAAHPRAGIVVAVIAALVAAGPAAAATNNIFTEAGGGGAGSSGDNGPATSARLNTPVAVEMMGDGGYLIADQGNARVRRVAPDGTITTVAGTTPGFADGPVATARFSSAINGLAVLPDGSILVADSNNNRVRRIAGGNVTTVAGTGATDFNGDNMAATSANLNFPSDVSARPNGTYLIAENDNHRVRQVALDGTITTVAGTGTSGGAGDSGPATSAHLAGPGHVAVTSDGGYLVTELDGHRVRKVSAGGTIERVAGTGEAGGAGDGAAATSAQLHGPIGIAPRPGGGFIVAEHSGHRVRAVGADGVITRVAGDGTGAYDGDNQPAADAQLNLPFAVAIDGEGDYLIADALNHRIRRVDAGDPPPPAPGDPPPPPPREHTLLGVITYEPAYGLGFQGVELLGPFGANRPPSSVTVTLRDAAGSELARRTFSRGDGFHIGPVLYRFDDLGPCEPCTLTLTAGASVEDERTVSFEGRAGQTDANLVFGRRSLGGVVKGNVLIPFGGRVADLSVLIRDRNGKLLSDGTKHTTCARAGAGLCTSGAGHDYRLAGLPLEVIPVTVVLRQRTRKGQLVDVDRADITLDPSGTTIAPDLTAIPDLPARVGSRTSVHGQINYRGPFGPGARRGSDLDVPVAELRQLSVELRAPDGKLRARERRFARTPLGYTGYELLDVRPCQDCTLNLLDGRRVADSVPVTVPENERLVRRDFNYARAGAGEFVSGAVIAGDQGARGLAVAVTDANTGERLGSTEEGGQACAGGLRCPRSETLLYRAGEVPPDRDVILTLERKGKPLDTRRVRTAPAGEVTQAPLLVLPYGKGPRSIQGFALNGGPFPPGDEPRDPPSGTRLEARLLGPTQAELGRTRVAFFTGGRGGPSISYVLDNVPECLGCTLELLRADGVVEDRVGVDVRGDSPSVTVADLRWQALSGGAYVQGEIVVRSGSAFFGDLVVQVLGTDGKVLADSSKVRGARARPTGREAPGPGSFAYRLGGIPRDAGTVKVVVLDRKKKRLASTNVRLADGAADTKVPDLRVDLARPKGG